MVETVFVSLYSRNKNCQVEKASLHDVFIVL
jgi:hypothetical protein